MINYVFLDTNNWIYLANGFNPYSNKHEDVHLKVFELVKKRTGNGDIIFLVNSIIIDEFNRNKAQTQAKINDINQKVRNYTGSLKPIIEFLEGDDEELKKIASKISKTAELRISHLQDHIRDVENFLNTQTIVIPITNDHKIAASEMALAKKAPFIGDKKNSMADALHLLSFIGFMDELKSSKTLHKGFLPDEFISYFVSSNSGDFSTKGNTP